MMECPCDSCKNSQKNCIYSCERLKKYRREKTKINNEINLRYKSYNASLWNKETVRLEKAPCMNCDERYFGCHGKCEKYQTFRAERDRINNEKFKRIDMYYSAKNPKRRRHNTMLEDFKYRRKNEIS